MITYYFLTIFVADKPDNLALMPFLAYKKPLVPNFETSCRVVGSCNRVAGSSGKVAGGTHRVEGSSGKVAGTCHRVAGGSEKVAGSSGKVAGSTHRVAGGSEKVVGTGHRVVGRFKNKITDSLIINLNHKNHDHAH